MNYTAIEYRFINKAIRWVWTGEMDYNDILDELKWLNADDYEFEDQPLRPEVVMPEVARQIDMKEAEELTWPATTDVDRISNAFAELRSKRVHAAFSYWNTHEAQKEPITRLLATGTMTSPAYCACFINRIRNIRKRVRLRVRCNIAAEETFTSEWEDLVSFVDKTLIAHGLRTSRQDSLPSRIEIRHVDWKKRGQGPLKLSFLKDIERMDAQKVRVWG